MPIKVVKVKVGGCQYHPEIRYIGRSWGDWPESIFHNPFHVGKDGTREEVLLKFIEYWYAPKQTLLRSLALDLIGENAILGCWCKPLECHGDIIAAYVTWKLQERQLCLLIP